MNQTLRLVLVFAVFAILLTLAVFSVPRAPHTEPEVLTREAALSHVRELDDMLVELREIDEFHPQIKTTERDRDDWLELAETLPK